MEKKEKKKIQGAKLLKGIKRIVLLLWMICIALLIGNVVSHVKTQNSIKNNLNDILEQVSKNTDAQNIDVDIYSAPGDTFHFMQTDCQIFLTVHCDNLRSKTKKQWRTALLNGQEANYNYGYSNKNYAIYSMVLKLSGKEYPIFISVTDGANYYSLYWEVYEWDEPRIVNENAKEKLVPSKWGYSITVYIFASMVLFLGLITLNAFGAEREKVRKRIWILAITVAGIAVIAIATTTVIKKVITPKNQYKEAMDLKNNGYGEVAYQIFKDLGNYEDCVKICGEYDYEKALSYLEEEKYAKAYQLLVAIDQNEAAAQKAQELLNDRPYLEIFNAEAGDEVQLGFYEQGNGVEPVDWYVLAKENGNLLLTSKYILDAQQFNTNKTEECTLDDWLKNDFYNAAFADIDENIIDVTLLNADDLNHYIKSDQKSCEPTAYALSKEGFKTGYDGDYYYWLASSASSSNGKISASVAKADGFISGSNCSEVTNIEGVRPVLWICPNGEESFPVDFSEEYEYTGNTATRRKTSGRAATGSRKKCPDCNGTGYGYVIWYPEETGEFWGEKTYDTYPCTKCNGTGKI